MIIKLTPSHGEWDSWTSIKNQVPHRHVDALKPSEIYSCGRQICATAWAFPSCTNIWKATLTYALFLIKLLENDINDIKKKKIYASKMSVNFFPQVSNTKGLNCCFELFETWKQSSRF